MVDVDESSWMINKIYILATSNLTSKQDNNLMNYLQIILCDKELYEERDLKVERLGVFQNKLE